MSPSLLPPRRPGPLPEIPPAETDEILSSWLSRSADLNKARPGALLEQIGLTESSPASLDRHATPADLERLVAAMRSSPLLSTGVIPGAQGVGCSVTTIGEKTVRTRSGQLLS